MTSGLHAREEQPQAAELETQTKVQGLLEDYRNRQES